MYQSFNKVLDYNNIDEYKVYLQNNGTCVIDNLLGMYGQQLNLNRLEICNIIESL